MAVICPKINTDEKKMCPLFPNVCFCHIHLAHFFLFFFLSVSIFHEHFKTGNCSNYPNMNAISSVSSVVSNGDIIEPRITRDHISYG